MKITQPRFLLMVISLAATYQCSISSWIRTPARNAKVGGSPNSRHLVGMACDFIPDNRAVVPALIAEARGYGLDAVDEGDHIHIEADKRTD